MAAVAPTEREWLFDAHSHDFIETYCIIDGTAVHSGATEGRVVLTRGDIVMVPVGAWHAVGSDQGRPVKLVNVAFPAGSWTTLLSLAGLPLPSGQANLLEREAIGEAERTRRVRCFTRLLEDIAGPDPALGLTRLLIELADICRPQSDSEDRRSNWADHLTRLANDDTVIRAGLPELVARAGVSYGHLARLCSRELHVSPTQLVNRARIDRARLLLRTTTQPVVSIAHRTGFATVSHFYTVFHREAGLSPGAYRESVYSNLHPGHS